MTSQCRSDLIFGLFFEGWLFNRNSDFQLDLIRVSKVFPDPARRRDAGALLRDAGGLD